MDLSVTAEDEAFRAEVREWLAQNLRGEFEQLRGTGGSGREHEAIELRTEWEKALGAAGWIGLGLPQSVGGRGATLMQQVIFAEEYARADAPGRVNHMGEYLLAPTLVAFGSEELQRRFLPGILKGEEMWCQGYSEPGAGSDLAGVRTRLSYLLVPMDQEGVDIRPIVQITGSSEFSEVFFDDARTEQHYVVGEPGDGWKVAMGTLGFERGVATLAQQVGFQRELDQVIADAHENGTVEDPQISERLVQAWIELRVMRYQALRTLGTNEPAAASVSKLLWANWHRRLGELGIDIRGAAATVLPAEAYELTREQAVFLYTRADTIYAGSNEIQRNILAERVLGLPRG